MIIQKYKKLLIVLLLLSTFKSYVQYSIKGSIAKYATLRTISFWFVKILQAGDSISAEVQPHKQGTFPFNGIRKGSYHLAVHHQKIDYHIATPMIIICVSIEKQTTMLTMEE